MTNIKIESEVKNETIDKGIVHTDFLLNQYDSDTETDVTKLLNAMPDELKQIATDKFGFHMISENNLIDFIKFNVLTNCSFVDGIADEMNTNFENVLLPSLNKFFQNDVIHEYDEYNIKNELLNEISQFIANELIAKSKLTVNGEKIIINSEYEITKKYSENITNIDWIEKFKQSKSKQ